MGFVRSCFPWLDVGCLIWSHKVTNERELRPGIRDGGCIAMALPKDIFNVGWIGIGC
jgi:hypothetical protein